VRRILIIASLPVLALLFMAARPGSEFGMMQMLNGQPTRWTLPDGGQSGLYATSGKACAALAGSNAQVVMVVPETPTNLCAQPTTSGSPWDGGCNTIVGDVSFGVPLQPFQPWYIVLDPATTAICGASDAGTVQATLWRMN